MEKDICTSRDFPKVSGKRRSSPARYEYSKSDSDASDSVHKSTSKAEV